MYIRVKRDRLTIFVQVGASDTVHKIKQSLFDSLVFRSSVSSDDVNTDQDRCEALATIVYDDDTVYTRVQSADDIALVHCRYSKEDISPQQEEEHQGRESSAETTLLDGFKTLVDSKVENDDIVWIALKRQDTGEFEDVGPLVHHHHDSKQDTQKSTP